ncbi:MAG: hypothetical protein QM778_17165 [Myxococcales bacterium]
MLLVVGLAIAKLYVLRYGSPLWALVDEPGERFSEADDAAGEVLENPLEVEALIHEKPLEHWLGSIEDSLRRCRPDVLRRAQLRPPATTEALEQLAGELGHPLPPELLTLLRWHDGQQGRNSLAGSDYDYLDSLLLGTADIAATLQRLRGLPKYERTPLVPIMKSVEHSYFIAMDSVDPGVQCEVSLDRDAGKDPCLVDSLQQRFGVLALDLAKSCSP